MDGWPAYFERPGASSNLHGGIHPNLTPSPMPLPMDRSLLGTPLRLSPFDQKLPGYPFTPQPFPNFSQPDPNDMSDPGQKQARQADPSTSSRSNLAAVAKADSPGSQTVVDGCRVTMGTWGSGLNDIYRQYHYRNSPAVGQQGALNRQIQEFRVAGLNPIPRLYPRRPPPRTGTGEVGWCIHRAGLLQ